LTPNLASAASAWWCEARKDSGDIPAAAKALGVPVTVHHVAIQRADAVGRIEAALAEVQGNGAMRAFNAEYRRRRETALAVGRSYMSYERARARLRAVIASVIAKGGEHLGRPQK
jgi:hypothetical protein